MEPLTKIYIPLQMSSEMYLKGLVNCSDNITTIFLTSFSSLTNHVMRVESKNYLQCYCGSHPPTGIHKLPNYLIITGDLEVVKLVVNKQAIDVDTIMVLLYDYNKFRDSQTISASCGDFTKLHDLIRRENGINHTNIKERIDWVSKPYWLISSMFLQHVYNFINLLKWAVIIVWREKQISIKVGNLILAIMTDVIIGYTLLNIVSSNSVQISSQLMELLENIINMLYSLLTWLMGAPVGLKLNNAFNKMLGKFFSYHVQLWWLFLDICSKKLDIILDVYRYIGYLGFTFQIAVISDMICIATFHSYCIYVYAARLFNIQISGLIALLRLFVGRKYNPLRGSIDSCEYTNQELFVGTIAFTILLLLLPTTAMYYFVFTVFRLLSLSVQHILAKIIYIIQTLPLYVTTLWIFRSPKLAGNISIQADPKQNCMPLITVKLLSKSIGELLNIFKPPVEVPKQVEWTNLLSNALMGKQII